MSEESSKKLDPVLALAAPHRRRFLKQLLVGTSAVAAFLALPETRVLAQDNTNGRGKGKAKGKGDGKGKGKGTGKGKGKAAPRRRRTGKGKGTR